MTRAKLMSTSLRKKLDSHSGSINFVTAGIKTGDVITIGNGVKTGAGSTVGFAIVSSVVGVHTLAIFGTDDLVGSGTILSQDYYINEKPKYVLDDSTYDAPEVQSNRTVKLLLVLMKLKQILQRQQHMQSNMLDGLVFKLICRTMLMAPLL